MISSLALLLAGAAPVGLQASADPQAVTARAERLLRNANSVSGRLIVARGDSIGEARFFMEKPNLLAVISENKRDVFNGRDRTVLDLSAKEYEVRPQSDYGIPFLTGFENFIETPPGSSRVVTPSYTDATVVRRGGRTIIRRRAMNEGDTMNVDLDAETALPVRWTWVRAGETIVADVRDVEIGAPTPSGTFTINTDGLTRVQTVEERALLGEGTAGPNIEGRTLQGTTTSLTRIAQGKRATVVLFVDPTQSRSADALADAVRFGRKNNVAVVAVTGNSDDRVVRKFLANCRANGTPCFRGSEGAKARRDFGAALSPAVYVLDPEMKILGSSFGYDSAKIAAVLPARGR